MVIYAAAASALISIVSVREIDAHAAIALQIIADRRAHGAYLWIYIVDYQYRISSLYSQ